jgi:hypothetical protein
VVPKITEAEAKSGISNINAKISAPEEGQAIRDGITGIVPELNRMTKRIFTTLGGDEAAEKKLRAAATVINNHFPANKKTLGGTEFSNMINDLDTITGDLRQQGGKLSPAMRTVTEGIEKMVAALESHVSRNAPQEVKAEQNAARQRLRDFIEGTGRDAEKAEGPSGTTLEELGHTLWRGRFHPHALATDIATGGLNRFARSKGFRAIAPRLGQAAAVRATQRAEDANDSEN